MVVRWIAASLLNIETRSKRIMGYRQLWMLDAKLKELNEESGIDRKITGCMIGINYEPR